MKKRYYLMIALQVFFNSNVYSIDNMSMTKSFEGFKSKSYIDTVGVKTIGYGFNMKACNINKNIISKYEADIIFTREYEKAKKIAISYLGIDNFNRLSVKRQGIITDMAYNMGYKLLKFKKLRTNIINNNVKGVKYELKNSNWYKQVKNRGVSHVSNWNK